MPGCSLRRPCHPNASVHASCEIANVKPAARGKNCVPATRYSCLVAPFTSPRTNIALGVPPTPLSNATRGPNRALSECMSFPSRPNPVLAILLGVVTGCSIESAYVRSAGDEFTARSRPTPEVVTDEDLAKLPPPVERYLRFTGAAGRPKVWNMRVEMDAQMVPAPGADPFFATSEQHNFFDEPTRLFHMEARMFGLPVGVLHVYSHTKATMVVRLADTFAVVDEAGPELDETETVTLLNDMAVMAPATLIDPRLSWQGVSASQAQVTFQNGKHLVSAVLYFDEEGKLVDFASDDRSELENGVLQKRHFSTPLRKYKNFGGTWLASEGDAVYERPSGPFKYATFFIKNVEYNVPCFAARPVGPSRPTRIGLVMTQQVCSR